MGKVDVFGLFRVGICSPTRCFLAGVITNSPSLWCFCKTGHKSLFYLRLCTVLLMHDA